MKPDTAGLADEALQIRALQPVDAAAVAALVRRGFIAHVAADWEAGAAANFIEHSLSTEALAGLIAESVFTAGAFIKTESLLGVIIMPRPEWLELLFVDNAASGGGIGRRLWQEARRFVTGLTPKVQAVELHATAYALGFYRKLGFVPGETLLRNGRHGTRMTWRANA